MVVALQQQFSPIEARNRRVLLEKAWELNLAQNVSIVALTYPVMILVFWSLDNEKYAFNAIMPRPSRTKNLASPVPASHAL